MFIRHDPATPIRTGNGRNRSTLAFSAEPCTSHRIASTWCSSIGDYKRLDWTIRFGGYNDLSFDCQTVVTESRVWSSHLFGHGCAPVFTNRLCFHSLLCSCMGFETSTESLNGRIRLGTRHGTQVTMTT